MGGIDGKSKKILNYLKKNGDSEAIDIAFGLKMDETVAQNTIDAMSQSGLVVSWRNEHGRVFWNLPDAGDATNASAPAAASDAPVFDEFVLENEPVNRVTDTIVVPVVTSAPAPTPAPAPKPAPVPAPVSAPKPVLEEEEDFEPKKAKKAKKEKTAAIEDDGDLEPKASGSSGFPIKAVAAVAFVVLIIIIMGMGGSGKKALAAASDVEMKLSGQIESLKAENAAKISELEAKNTALESQVKKLEEDIKKIETASKAPAKAAAPARRRR